MTTTFTTETSTFIEIVNDFNQAWNEKDINSLAGNISEDIIYRNPPIKIGFLKLAGKEIHGKFKVLKFWAEFLSRFDSSQKIREVLSEQKTENGHEIICVVENSILGVASDVVYHFNENKLMDSLSFTNVSGLNSNKELSAIEFMFKQMKRKFVN